jgi:octaprenyl-diphosphate synthase
MSIDAIRSLIVSDLDATDHAMRAHLQSDIPMINQVVEYILLSGGKRIRPMIVLLAARALAHTGKQHIDLAAAIELIHTATLLHDDVVDGATLRRGRQTAHHIWGSSSSVLIGDFIYSRTFQVIVNMHHQPILDTFANATHYIAEGEILQLANCHNPDTTENFYFDIIQRKTAKLFEIAAELGALIDHHPPDRVMALREFGKHIGLAYQLVDDALDYSQPPEETGKNIGQDLAEGKTTLPLIHAMRESGSADLPLLRDAIAQAGSGSDLGMILRIIESTGAIQYTLNAARQHAEQAKKALASLIESPYCQALFALSDFVVSRTY